MPVQVASKNKIKRTKIVATIGPATSSPARIKSLLIRGVDVIRVNFSHGNHEVHRKTITQVRAVAKELGLYTAILGDLCGPKIRTGSFEKGEIELNNGDKVIVTTREVLGSKGLIFSQYTDLHKDIQTGQRILLDDGKMELLVEAIDGQDISCLVTYGGTLTDNKGMNLPDTAVSMSALTEKDKKDLKLAIECRLDFIALSFVRDTEDIQKLVTELESYAVDIPIIAKIERPEAIDNIDDIIKTTYGIMIARGDLGIELAAEKVPLIQNNLIDKARMAQKPVIVATQMMESMITNSRPTRAEINDVANAVIRSADAVMLSGETSVGKYPLQTVEYMSKAIREIEQDCHSRMNFTHLSAVSNGQPMGLRKSMSKAALSLTKDLALDALLVPTNTGTTARTLSSDRPLSIILGVSHHLKTCHKMSIHWGIIPVYLHPLDFRDWRGLASKVQHEYGLLSKGEQVLVVAGFAEHSEDSEPVLKLLTIK